jgi:extradiol dioxygenase family protein
MGLMSYYRHMFQVSYVTKDLDRAVAFLGKKLGCDDFAIIEPEAPILVRGEPKTFKLRVAIANVGGHQFEVIQPVSGAIDVYRDGIEYGRSVATLHHVGLALQGPYSEWERLEEELRAAGQEFVIVSAPMPGPKQMVRFGYVDTRPHLGHFTEYLWWSDELPAGNPAFPDLSR